MKNLANQLRLKLPPNIKYVLAATAVLLGINFVFRCAFLLYNQAQFWAMSWTDVLFGFLLGIRFDLATILIFNGLVFLAIIIPIRSLHTRRSYRWFNLLILIFNIPVIVLNGIDIVYFSYAEKRLTHELFTTKSDYGAFKPSMLAEWWWIFLLAGITLFIGYRILDRASKRYLEKDPRATWGSPARLWGYAAVFLILAVIGIRGVNKKPLESRHAFVEKGTFLGNMGLNSAFTVLSCINLREEGPITWIPQKDAVRETRNLISSPHDGPFNSKQYPLWRKSHFDTPEKHYNVVFLIIESFNARHVGSITGDYAHSLTPNLDTMVRHGRMFTNFYANGVRSVEALPALLNSMPEIFRRPTIGSSYIDNNHYGLGHILGDRGYYNSFFCGAHNGTMGFDEYAAKSAIPNYYGMNEYPHAERDFDGFWGCADGPVLHWMAEKQNSFQQPFFSTFFSISNHHPFNLPPQASEELRNAEGFTKMEKTTVYSDLVLGEYFREVSQYPWFDSTIFILTGDHCFHEESIPDRPIMENFHVPLFMMGPGIEPGLDDRLGNHISVMPTLIDLMDLETDHSSIGVSLFSDRQGFALNNLLELTTLAIDSIAFTTNFDGTHFIQIRRQGKWVDVDESNPGITEKIQTLGYQLRSIYQVLFNTRVGNSLVDNPGGTISLVEP